MIIQALTQYYDILTQNEECSIPRYGYSTSKTSFVLQISDDGKICHIIDIRSKDKKPKPKVITVPKQDARSFGIAPYFLCENAKYIFGVELILSKDRKEYEDDPSKIVKILEDIGGDMIAVTKRSQDCFGAFKSLHHSILDSIDLLEGRKFLSFLDTWEPEEFLLNPKILEYKDEILKGVQFIFEINGSFLHDLPEIRVVWENHVSKNGLSDQISSQCLVTGLIEPISQTHNVIKGVAKAQKAGARLVSFHSPSFESYGRKESFNAPIGITAEFKYTTLLNYLLADPKNKIRIADSTVIFWAETSGQSFVKTLLFPFSILQLIMNEKETDNPELIEQRIKDEKTIQLIRDILTKVRNSQPLDPKTIGVNPETRFYILGLSPNNARLAVRFWYRDTFGHFVNRIARNITLIWRLLEVILILHISRFIVCLRRQFQKVQRMEKLLPYWVD